jgi:acetyl-CoA carboxylase biotin carboxyl carrier protein
MDIKEIKELVKLIDSSSITEFLLDKENFKISIKKEQVNYRISDSEQIDNNRQSDAIEKVVESEEKTIDIKKEGNDIHLIKSPIVGMYYSSPSPDEEAFVNVGKKVKKGDVLCIIEAMKLMNEVTSDVDGEIIEALVENKNIVEYGQPLFKVRKV